MSSSSSSSGGNREQKRAALHQKLQQLGSVTNSTAGNAASIIEDASRYIEELKERVEKKYQESDNRVTVETLDEKGFLINVFSENIKGRPGVLVSVLEAFEELGLEVVNARVSCSDAFLLQAVSEKEGQVDSIDARMVKQAVLQAINNNNWRGSDEED